MWPQIEKYLPEFPSAVLSGLDAAGDPYSVRCHPVMVPDAQALHVALPPGVALQPGPACVLCHTHNERLWHLKSFVARGALARGEAGGAWVFQPETFIPGMGIGGWRSYVHFVRHGRAATKAYFARRGQPVPHVDFESVLALFASLPGTTP